MYCVCWVKDLLGQINLIKAFMHWMCNKYTTQKCKMFESKFFTRATTQYQDRNVVKKITKEVLTGHPKTYRYTPSSTPQVWPRNDCWIHARKVSGARTILKSNSKNGLIISKLISNHCDAFPSMLNLAEVFWIRWSLLISWARH